MIDGTITAYSPGPLGDDDEFTLPMTVDEVKKLLSRVDTVFTEDIETGDLVETLIPIETTSEEILQMEIKEDWFFDNERSVMDVRIIGICPMKEKLDDFGEFRGFSRLFWVYFPEARHVLANAEVYNVNKNAERRTYDDIFWKRQFGSYITKRSNVYDRVIEEYKTGLDALLESQALMDDIRIIEHDLWHF
jgi:gliding motility associated protien GldN